MSEENKSVVGRWFAEVTICLLWAVSLALSLLLALIHRSVWKGCSTKFGAAPTVRLR
jgi:hypothetical protein